MEKLVSIIIPTFNRAEYLSETITSALNQTYKNIEIIIVDNNSSDSSWKLIESFSRKHGNIICKRNSINIGPVKNWLECAKMASGEYIKFLFSDDLLAPRCIERLVYELSNPLIGFAMCDRVLFAEIEQGVSERRIQLMKTGVYKTEVYRRGRMFKKNYPNSPGCAIFRTLDVLENITLDVPNKCGSNFSMHGIGADVLLFLRISRKYKNFAYLNEPLVCFRAHSDSISIGSRGEKLNLNYSIAIAHFLENYYPERRSIRRFNSVLANMINRYPNNSLKLRKVSDFYFSNEYVDRDLFMSLKLFAREVIRKLKIFVKKLVVKVDS